MANSANAAGDTYLITADGKVALTNPAEVVTDAAVVSDALLQMIPTATTKLTAPAFVRGGTDKNIYYLSGAQKRSTISAAERAVFNQGMANPAVQVIPASALAQITTGPPILAPGTYIHSAKSGLNYWITGTNSMALVSTTADALQYGLSKPRTATGAELVGYKQNTKLTGTKISCDAQNYVAIAGAFYPIAAESAVHYPGAAIALDPLACARLKLSATELGRFIKTPDKVFWLVQSSKRRQIASAAKYEALRGGLLPAVAVDYAFAHKLTIGAAAPAVLVEATPTATPTATPIPTTTPTSAPTPTPTPSPSASATKTYIVVSGDTLSKIAAKFGVSVTALKSANKLTSDTIKLGQKLVIP